MIKVVDIKYVWYQVTDLDKTERFLTDFGLVRAMRDENMLFMRAAGPSPYCYVCQRAPVAKVVSIGLQADPAADLADATKIAGASGIEDITWPGGGKRVRLMTPSGLRLDIVAGIAAAAPLPAREALPLNNGRTKARLNMTQRPPKGPAQILRIGHCGVSSTDTAADMKWVGENLGMLVSDYVTAPDTGTPIGGFVRVNCGEKCVDHHILGFFPSDTTHVHHSSFEIEDLDALFMGSQWLARNGHRHDWGIGRHVLGSQLFDYWIDPDGQRIEHYTDGDLFNASKPPGAEAATPDSLCTWGPDLPEQFLAA